MYNLKINKLIDTHVGVVGSILILDYFIRKY